MSAWLPLLLVVPLAAAAVLLALGHWLPSRAPDLLALLTAAALAVLCASLARYADAHGPMTYWFGGWTPTPQAVLGIAFGADAASLAVAGFAALLCALVFVFAWGYFEQAHAHFHILMLLFLAAMIGFALTRDLFNLFVWFEVMSVAAFTLTAYQLEAPSLAGALNFTITNSLASVLMLAGVGLIYARTGVLDFAALRPLVAAHAADPVTNAAFCLLSVALLIKAAILPFHFWLSDAHAVAPSPVSVIFSGIMVSLALFVLGKLALGAFAESRAAQVLLPQLMLPLGALTALVGGVMAWHQRHLKRLLAFSTIAHLGAMLAGLATVSRVGLGALLVYLVGHGLVKGALFMVAGILLATRAAVDELALKGLGRGLAPAGIAMAIGGLLLAGAPAGVLDAASGLLHESLQSVGAHWSMLAVELGAVLTGGAVLRASGRIFLDLGADPGDEAEAPSQDEQERANRPQWLMLLPCAVLLALAAWPPGPVSPALARAVTALAAGPPVLIALNGSPAALGWITTALAIAVATIALMREHLPASLADGYRRAVRPFFALLKRAHSGLVGDYVVWIAIGLAMFVLTVAQG